LLPQYLNNKSLQQGEFDFYMKEPTMASQYIGIVLLLCKKLSLSELVTCWFSSSIAGH
jgi:hypothetical protein